MNGDPGASKFLFTSQSDDLIKIVERLEALRVRFRRGFGQDRGFDIDLVNKVYILTQFNLASLSRHISRAYNSALKNYTCDYSRLRMLVFIISEIRVVTESTLELFDPSYVA
ncbi:hypothetical protein AHAS_Ahas09G0148500 [Arachis hypogaea]